MEDKPLGRLVQENLIQAGMYVRSNRILGEKLLSLLEPVLHGGVTMCDRVKNSIRLTANPGCFDWADNTITNLCCVLGDLLKGVSIGSPRPIYLTKNEAEYMQTIIRGAMEPIPAPKENDEHS